MINALQVVCEINALLPAAQRPEHTEEYDGFYHLVGINGTVEQALRNTLSATTRVKSSRRKRLIYKVP